MAGKILIYGGSVVATQLELSFLRGRHQGSVPDDSAWRLRKEASESKAPQD
jgi:hypothetical protein